jgi:hypothetical protein
LSWDADIGGRLNDDGYSAVNGLAEQFQREVGCQIGAPGNRRRRPDANVSLELSRVPISALADFAIAGIGIPPDRNPTNGAEAASPWIARKRL